MSCWIARAGCCAPMRPRRGAGGLPATAEDVDPRFIKLLLAYEDKRFYAHHGVDALALGRAAYQLVRHGEIVSGASTLTMQVARLLEPREHRSFGAKLRQMTRALQLEHALDKKQILSLYLTLAPYGGNLEGIRAASLAYFGKEPRRLSLAQAALLVALAAIARNATAGSLSGDCARCPRSRARPRGRARRRAARRNRTRRKSAGADCTRDDAGLRAAFVRSHRRARAQHAHSSPHHRRALAGKARSLGARACPYAWTRYIGRHSRGR